MPKVKGPCAEVAVVVLDSVGAAVVSVEAAVVVVVSLPQAAVDTVSMTSRRESRKR